MGRRKIEIKAIKDDRNRSVTFLKRKGGLFKKAYELSVLCSVDVAVIIFGHNKKLYEFSSGDINETIGRYQYYGGAHEHKGPEDFSLKKDGGDDDDDEEEMEGSPRPISHSPPEHAMMPHHLQNQPGFQHLGHSTPSASPPMPNGTFNPRHPSPQPPHNLSRPSSRAHIRRQSSNLMPPGHHQATQPVQNRPNYAYMPNPPIYNPQAAAGLPMRGPPGHPIPGQPQQQQYQYPPHPPQHQQVQQVYQQEQQRRQSMPPAFPPQERQPTPQQQQPQQQSQQHPPQSHVPSPPQPEQKNFQSPPLPQPKALAPSANSHSIFTPIDDSRSLLAQHWGNTSTADPARSDAAIKAESVNRSQSIDVASMSRNNHLNGRPDGPPPPPPHTNSLPQPQRTASTSSIPSIGPPSRVNSMASDAKRPRLKVQIPSEHSDGGEATADSSPKDTAAASVKTPVRGAGEGHGSGVVLPPPSPSASALLSAGATGPPNPFARPPPPGANSFPSNRSDLETPISALPSRFVADQLLPSPSSFYPEWGFGRESNMLPSPLNFQTPVAANGPSFRDEDVDRKRKISEGSENGSGKKIKT